MRDTAEHHIIQGNFAPSRGSRILGVTARVFSLLFGLFVVGALIVYGINVHYEDAINKVARDTRELNEHNKELQVRLNHIRSFKNVEAAAAQVPHLHMAETVIDIPPSAPVHLPQRPHDAQEFPRVYGY